MQACTLPFLHLANSFQMVLFMPAWQKKVACGWAVWFGMEAPLAFTCHNDLWIFVLFSYLMIHSRHCSPWCSGLSDLAGEAPLSWILCSPLFLFVCLFSAPPCFVIQDVQACLVIFLSNTWNQSLLQEVQVFKIREWRLEIMVWWLRSFVL